MKQNCCYENINKAVRKGRASYACFVCGKDISIAHYFYMEAITANARILGSLGGKSKSEKKIIASRENGKKNKGRKGLSTETI